LKLGPPIAAGARSTVHGWGNDAVAKVPVDGTPDAWIRFEAGYCAAVYLAGAPVPEFLGFEEHEGRTVSIYRRARGSVMSDAVVAEPSQAAAHGRRLAAIQVELTSLIPPVTLPAQIDRLRSKIRIAARHVDPTVMSAAAVVQPSTRVVLCHGDLHPSNVILTTDGPVVVDWFDASRGDPVADIARTLLLLGGPTEVVATLRAAYRDAAMASFDVDTDVLARWQAATAVARIAEGFDPRPLLDVWATWSAGQPALSEAGR